MFRKFIVFATVIAVSGCVETQDATKKQASAGLVQTVSKDRLTGKTSKVNVRTFGPSVKKGIRGAEIVGATCNLASDELRARFVAPEEVILPTFKQDAELPNRGIPGSIAITCEADGLSGTTILTANEKSVATTTGAGVAGALLTLAVSSAIATSTPWRYPAHATVTLE